MAYSHSNAVHIFLDIFARLSLDGVRSKGKRSSILRPQLRLSIRSVNLTTLAELTRLPISADLPLADEKAS